jgi:hypothetical protein
VAETNGLLNRRTGKSGTEGSNPSVSANYINHCKIIIVQRSMVVYRCIENNQSTVVIPCQPTKRARLPRMKRLKPSAISTEVTSTITMKWI